MNELRYIRPPHALEQVIARTNELGFNIASEPRTGALLKVWAASKPGGNFLELGTETGIATAWLLDGMDNDSKLISVDTDSKVQDVAQVLRVVKPSGFYVIDDMLPQPNWPDGHAAKVPALMGELAADESFSISPLA